MVIHLILVSFQNFAVTHFFQYLYSILYGDSLFSTITIQFYTETHFFPLSPFNFIRWLTFLLSPFNFIRWLTFFTITIQFYPMTHFFPSVSMLRQVLLSVIFHVERESLPKALDCKYVPRLCPLQWDIYIYKGP